MIGCRYGYSFNLSRITSLTLGVGALLGYENPPVRTKENKVLRYKSKFNFGLDLSPQLEVALTKKLSLFAYPRVMYIINSNFENFIFTGGLGFKLYL